MNQSDLSKLDALISGKPEAPERIYGWLDSQMSIARFYGGCTYNGHTYSIAPSEPGAPLVRADVLAREAKERKEQIRANRKEDQQRIARAQGVML